MKTVVQVIGTTGVGKSQLGIELAKQLNGEIINSDSMQVYRGLDIITNKHPLEKREGVPHHLLSFLRHDEEYRIGAYEKDASNIIDDLHEKDKLPLVVGGTAYYATALVFQDMLPAISASKDDTPAVQQKTADPRLEKSTAELYADLQAVDPVMATRWHPNDHRKIRRSLEIYYTSGRRQSEIYAEQRDKGRLGPQHVKYRTLFLWLYSEQSALDARLDTRIDEMIASGLFDEIRDMHALQQREGVAPDFTRGIYQAIGYKEFQAYLKSGADTDRLAGTAAMKAATRRYARKQIKWIRNKLLLQCREAGDNVQIVLLDATNLEHWNDKVLEQGLAATKDFIEQREILATQYCADKDKHTLLTPKIEKEFSANPEAWERRTCESCPGFVTNSKAGWLEHLASSGHKNKVSRIKKRKEYEAYLAAKNAAPNMVKQSSNDSSQSETTSKASSDSQMSPTTSVKSVD